MPLALKDLLALGKPILEDGGSRGGERRPACLEGTGLWVVLEAPVEVMGRCWGCWCLSRWEDTLPVFFFRFATRGT